MINANVVVNTYLRYYDYGKWSLNDRHPRVVMSLLMPYQKEILDFKRVFLLHRILRISPSQSAVAMGSVKSSKSGLVRNNKYTRF